MTFVVSNLQPKAARRSERPSTGAPLFPSLLAALVFIASILVALPAVAADTSATLKRWLESQSTIRTWSADFVQTRTLKTLTQPLTSTGLVWFATPDRFRWELGKPAQTIAMRNGNTMLVAYPRLKRAERYALSGAKKNPWRDALTLLEAGFPRSAAELDRQFRVAGETESQGTVKVRLEPRSSGARRMIPEITVEFGASDLALRTTELRFADGSTLRNDFKNPTLNPAVPDELFELKVDADYKVTEPLAK